MVECLTHPDPGYLGDAEKRALNAEFLHVLRERSGIWHALPRDVARWWRLRDSGMSADMCAGVARTGHEPREVAFEVSPAHADLK